MGSSRSLPAMGTWAAPTRRAKISLTARTAPSARSGRESRAATEGIEDDRDHPSGSCQSGGFTGEATVRADEGIPRETELGQRLGVREEPPVAAFPEPMNLEADIQPISSGAGMHGVMANCGWAWS